MKITFQDSIAIAFAKYLSINVNTVNPISSENWVKLAEIILKYGFDKKFEHKYDSSCFYIEAKELNKIFGRSQFGKLINETNTKLIILRYKANHLKKSTKAYKITIEAKELVDCFLNTLVQTLPEYSAKFKPAKRLSKLRVNNAIRSRDAKNNTAKKKFNIDSQVKVNIDKLKSLACVDYYNNLDKDMDKHIRNRLHAIKLIEAVDENECIRFYYCESSSGRLYGEGLHLQNTSRIVRNAALDGLYDYDISNCHFSIMYQLCERQGVILNNVRHYMNNKSQIRKDISEYVGVEEDKIKKALISLMYGAILSSSPCSSIPDTIGKEQVDKFIKHSFVNGLYNELKKNKKVLISNAKKNGQNYLNAMNKSTNINEKKSSILSHLIQGVEASILNIIGEIHGDNIVLLQHDGWVSKIKIDKVKLMQNIYDRSGFNIMIEEEKIKCKEYTFVKYAA